MSAPEPPTCWVQASPEPLRPSPTPCALDLELLPT
jgi:hypothetical protein